MDLRKELQELKKLEQEETRSDLQGLTKAKAFDWNKKKAEEIDEVLLQFCDELIDLNEAIKELKDLI
jgi:acyl-CoA reductase-like NAD-dependent aldehyde dehydrogenase